MGAIDGIPLLLQAADVAVRRHDEQISKVHDLMNDPVRGGQTSLVNSLRVITVQIEVTVVGVFSIFEARMQHHFSGGGFFWKLRDSLTEDGQDQLAARVINYYRAVNVLKHGRGDSYDKLAKIDDLPFSLKQPEEAFFREGDVAEPEGLIDIRAPGFCDGLIETLRAAYHFLEPEGRA